MINLIILRLMKLKFATNNMNPIINFPPFVNKASVNITVTSISTKEDQLVHHR